MNCFNIARVFRQKSERGWKRVYWCIDLHDTIIPGTYSKMNDNCEFYPDAKEVLQNLSNREDMVLILWTSSHTVPIVRMLSWFAEHKINFKFVNENPLEPSTALCDFSYKFYFNILLDDKAGFVGETDWTLIKNELRKLNEWNN